MSWFTSHILTSLFWQVVNPYVLIIKARQIQGCCNQSWQMIMFRHLFLLVSTGAGSCSGTWGGCVPHWWEIKKQLGSMFCNILRYAVIFYDILYDILFWSLHFSMVVDVPSYDCTFELVAASSAGTGRQTRSAKSSRKEDPGKEARPPNSVGYGSKLGTSIIGWLILN